MSSMLGPEGNDAVSFRPHLFGAFDRFRCPLQLRRAMTSRIEHITEMMSKLRATEHSDSTIATERGIEFEREVIEHCVRAEYGDSNVIECTQGHQLHPNDEFFKIISQQAAKAQSGTAGKVAIDQLNIEAPPGFHLRHLGIDDKGAATMGELPLEFRQMKPDVVVISAIPSCRQGEGAKVLLTIADIKSSPKMKRSHRLQVAFYALVIKDILADGVDRGKLPKDVAFHVAENAEVWLPETISSWNEWKDARQSAANTLPPPLRRPSFDLAAAEDLVRSFFQRAMKLVRLPDIEDVPWHFEPSRCTGCGNWEQCERKAIALRHAPMCLGLPPHEKTEEGTPILRGVPLTAPKPGTFATLDDVEASAKMKELCCLVAQVAAQQSAFRDNRAVVVDFRPHPRPLLPGWLITDSSSGVPTLGSFTLGQVAAVVIVGEQNGAVGDFCYGEVNDECFGADDRSAFWDALGTLDVLLLWDGNQAHALEDLMWRDSQAVLLRRFFPGVDSVMAAGANCAISESSSTRGFVHILQPALRDSFALPIAGRQPSFADATKWILGSDDTHYRGQSFTELARAAAAAATSTAAGTRLSTTLRSLFKALAENPAVQRHVRDLPGIQQPFTLQGGGDASAEDHVRHQMRHFHHATRDAECYTSRRHRAGLSGRALHHWVFSPDTTSPSLLRFRVLSDLSPETEWSFLQSEQEALLALHACFSAEAKADLHELRRTVRQSEASREYKYTNDMQSGRWYCQKVDTSSQEPWNLLDSSNSPLANMIDFSPGNLLIHEASETATQDIDQFDDAALYHDGGWAWRVDSTLLRGCGLGHVVASEMLRDEGQLFVYVKLLRSIKLVPGKKYVVASRVTNMNFEKITDTLDSLRCPSDPLICHCLPTLLPSSYSPPARLGFENGIPPQATEDQRRFFHCVDSQRLAVLWGPPGTGKTLTLAWMLGMLLTCGHASNTLVVAFTHKALGELRHRLQSVCVDWRIDARWERDEKNKVDYVKRQDGRQVVFATVWGAWKLFKKGHSRRTPVFPTLVVDEASQLSVMDALVASGCVSEGSRVVLAGDALQLPPIVSPKAQQSRFALSNKELQPILLGSVLEAVLFTNDRSRRLSREDLIHARDTSLIPPYVVQLSTTYRSAVPDLVDFIGHIYPQYNPAPTGTPCAILGLPPLQLLLIDDAKATPDHEAEKGASLLRMISRQCAAASEKSVTLGIVTPHRRQRELFHQVVADFFKTGGAHLEPHNIKIDTAEKMQGQQFDIVLIVIATVKASFGYNLNRLNVAFSRARRSIIVLTSRSVLNPAADEVGSVVSQLLRTSTDHSSAQKDVALALSYLQEFEQRAEKIA